MRPTRSDSLLVAVGAVVTGIAGFGFTWVLARATGPAGSGVVLTVTTWFTLLLTLGKFGLDTTLVREGGRLRVGGAGVGSRSLLRWTLVPVVTVVALVGILIAIAAAPIGAWMLADSPVSLTPLVVALGLLLPFGVFTVVQLAYARGLGSMKPFVLIEQILKPGVRFAGGLALLALGVTGALAYGWAWFLPVFLGGVLTALLAWRLPAVADIPAADGGVPGDERARVWRYAGPRAASQAVDIANTSFGTIALGVSATAAQTGAFATALRVIFAGQLVFQAIRLLVAPAFAAMLAEGRLAEAREVFSASTALIVALAWPAFLVCLLLPDLVLSVFGSGFAEAAPALRILAISGLWLGIVGNQGSVVLMAGRSAAALGAVSAGLVANVVFTVALLAVWGPVAAAIGWTAAVIVESLFLARTLRAEGFRPLPVAALRMAVRVAVPLVPSLLLAAALAPSGLLPAAGCVLVGFAVVAAWAGPVARREFHLLTRGEAHVAVAE